MCKIDICVSSILDWHFIVLLRKKFDNVVSISLHAKNLLENRDHLGSPGFANCKIVPGLNIFYGGELPNNLIILP